MHVIGTAGHVDHGKSTLIAALTGTHPDRLKEEQEREMTIELGFGWLTLPDGEEIGIVDVPGHRDFIENMLAGVGGIDAVLLVIAADEGMMPQTREHLAILDLLQIPAGLIVLTKADLTPDFAWLELIEGDIRLATADTVLKDAPILRVSARTGEGLGELVKALGLLLHSKPGRPDLHRPRLPIDRVFSMSGFGTVVTGTLSDGVLSLADEIAILPGGQKGRVRGLQTHKKKEEQALPGSRTAVNITGIAAGEIHRGDVLIHPGQYQAVRRLDARFHMIKEASAPLKHAAEVKFFVGAGESVARIRLLGKEQLLPGEEGWIQLELDSPVVAVRGDRYILRRPSPGETLGGGAIVDHLPAGRHKRFDEKVLRSLESLARGTPAEILLEAALVIDAAPLAGIVVRSRLDSEPAMDALNELIEDGRLVLLEEGVPSITSDLLVMAQTGWTSLKDKTLKLVMAYHQSFPLRRGMPREELKSRLGLETRVFNAVLRKLSTEQLLMQVGAVVSVPGHAISFSDEQQTRIQEMISRFVSSPYSTPSIKEGQAELGQEVLNALIELDELVPVSQDVIFRKIDYDAMVAKVRAVLHQNGQITLGEVRDMFGTSRKYAQALLEHLDATGLTVRSGDSRKLRQ